MSTRIECCNYSLKHTLKLTFNRTTLPVPFTIDRNELDNISQRKLLGVTIDNSLSFQVHIKEICRKVHTKVSILRRIRKLIPQETILKLNMASILPHFEYSAPLFLGLN